MSRARQADRATLPGALERQRERVRRAVERRQAWLEHLVEGGAAVSPLVTGDEPEAEWNWWASRPDLAIVDEPLAGDDDRWSRLVEIFGLTAPERDLLACCAVDRYDPGAAAWWASVQGGAHAASVTDGLVARLFGHGRSLLLPPDSALLRWRLARRPDEPGGNRVWTADAHAVAWLAGEEQLPEVLVPALRSAARFPPLPDWPVQEVVERHRRAREGGACRALVVIGEPGGGRTSFAAAVAAELGAVTFAFDADRVADESWAEAWIAAQRLAFLDLLAVAWSGERLSRPVPAASLPHFPLRFLLLEPGQRLHPSWAGDDDPVILPPLTREVRNELWSGAVPDFVVWSEGDRDRVLRRSATTPEDIGAVAATAPAGADDALRRLNRRHNDRLGDLARPMAAPYTWDDLVLPADVGEHLRDVMREARARDTFWNEPGRVASFPRGRGLHVLLVGRPGTGKTMAALVLSRELGVDCYRIDLASVVDKYVGETEKHLRRVLTAHGASDTVLFFDEADALLGKRTEVRDAHDRFANTQVNFLLQAIEDHPGIVILASNRQEDIDHAFMRRLRYVISLPEPGPEERLEIWRRALARLGLDEIPPTVERALPVLAREVSLTGAQITNGLLGAALGARGMEQPLGLDHLIRSIDRELIKEGRGLAPRDRERLGEALAAADEECED